jgi:hypothetical protein
LSHFVIFPGVKSYKTNYESEGTTLVLALILGIFGINGVGHIYVGKVGDRQTERDLISKIQTIRGNK